MEAMSVGLAVGQILALLLFILSEAIGISGLKYNSLLQVLAPAAQHIAGLLMNTRKPEEEEENTQTRETS